MLKSLSAKFADIPDDGAAMLKRRWAEVAGPQLSKLCEPVRIIIPRSTAAAPKPGALELRVAGAYAPLVQHQAQTLIDRVNLFLGGKTVERLRIVQAPLTAPVKAPAWQRPLPLSAAEELRLQDQLHDVGDDRLKATLLRLGRAVMQKQGSRVK